jgi:hypothetical protein
MNPHGISVFYGATEPAVAIAEVRPPVGSSVLVGSFEVTRQLTLLDLTAAADVNVVGSVFDPSFGKRLEHAMFLRSLSKRITEPVMPDDELLDYLPTQAIADFLASQTDPALDGIVFPSSQASGVARNVVLFHKAARVARLDLPRGTEVIASTGQMYEEGWEIDYSVREEVPASTNPEADKIDLDGEQFDFAPLQTPYSPSDQYDGRTPTLCIALETLEVHIIKAVQYASDNYEVRRSRSEKHKWKF